MKLFLTPTSPYARKVRVLLLEKKIPFEVVAVDLPSPASPVRELNPLGKVPTLVDDDGEVYVDSMMMAEMLDARPGPRLIPDPPHRWSAQRVAAVAQGMMDVTVNRLLETRRPEAQQSKEFIAKCDDKLVRAFAWAEARIGGARYWVEDRFTIADLSFACAVDYYELRVGDAWREKHPKLLAWFTRISERPTMIETRPPR